MPKKVQISKRNTALLAALFSIAGITVSSSVTAVGTDGVKPETMIERTASRFSAVKAPQQYPERRPRSAETASAAPVTPVHVSQTQQADPVISSASVSAGAAANDSMSSRRMLMQPVLGNDGSPLPNVNQSDSPLEVVTLVSGRGKRQRVVTAIQKIVPSGWSGFSSDDGIKDWMRVSWRANDVAWPEALNKVLAQSKLKALINWEKKEVDIMAFVEVAGSSPDPVVEPQAVKFGQADTSLSEAVVPQRQQVPEVVAPRVKPASRVAMANDLGSNADRAVMHANAAKLMQSATPENRRTGAYAVTQAGSGVVPDQRVAMLKDIDSEAKMAAIAAAEAEALSLEVERAELADAQATLLQLQNNKPTSTTYTSVSSLSTSSAPERYRRLKIEGSSTTRNVLVQSAGFNVPLLTALADVSPKGWLIYSKEGNFSTKMMTAWRGGNRPWLEVIDEMLAAYNLTAVVRHNSREIQVIQSQ